MAEKSRISTWSVLRLFLLPCLLLFSIFRNPIFQWIALAILLVWLIAELIRLVSSRAKKKPRRNRRRAGRRNFEAEPVSNDAPDNSLLLQVNYRITEQLKGTYPAIAWLWIERPESEEIKRGGTWRISLENADPFNYAEISLQSNGAMKISLMQILPLFQAAKAPEPDGSDLRADEILDRFDVRKWYADQGEKELCGIVEELNTQGFRRLRINESGDVMIGSSGSESSFASIGSFPPKSVWEDLCVLMREDDLRASVEGTQLAIAW